MSARQLVQVVEDRRYRAHRGPDGHPERPERLAAVSEALDPFRERLRFQPPRAASADEIRFVHDASLLDALEATRGEPAGQLDADTYVGPQSFDTALLAAGGAVQLLDDVLAGRATSGLAAVRPPGHHAEAHRAMGFCLFNNVAVAARATQAAHGEPRLMILDWDVHHGNGTQHLFEHDPSVFYVSTHQFPFYPGTGAANEIGQGRGVGTTLNVPMPAGCGDAEYRGVLERVIGPAARWFRPDAIVVSCGFDAHRADPLASMDLSFEGYRALARGLRALADELCGGRIVHVLEGGYALVGVREGTRAVVESLLEEPATTPSPDPGMTSDPVEPGSALRHVLEPVVAAHGARITDLRAD